MEINPRSYVPRHIQLADILREQIRSDQLAAGETLPGEQQLARRYGVSRESVRKALAVLRAEGLVVTIRGEATRVRMPRERRRVVLGAGAQATIRMPTPAERAERGIDEGVALVVISRPGAEPEVLPSDEVILVGE